MGLFKEAHYFKSENAFYPVFDTAICAARYFNALLESFPALRYGPFYDLEELPVILSSSKVANKRLLKLADKYRLGGNSIFSRARRRNFDENKSLTFFLMQKIRLIAKEAKVPFNNQNYKVWDKLIWKIIKNESPRQQPEKHPVIGTIANDHKINLMRKYKSEDKKLKGRITLGNINQSMRKRIRTRVSQQIKSLANAKV